MTRLPALSSLLLASLGACTDASSPMVSLADRPYVRVADGTPYALRSVGVDSTTYRDLVAAGAGGSALVDLGPSQDAGRTVRLRIDGGGPAALYTALLGPDSTSTRVALAGSELGVLFGDDTTTAIGLLLPAVQKVRGAALETDGTFELDLVTPGDIVATTEAAAGGVSVAVGDVTGDGRGGAAAPIGGSVTLRLAERAVFTQTPGGLASGEIVLAEPESLPAWFDPSQLDSAALDLRDTAGRILHRIRIDPPAMARTGTGTLTLSPANAIYIKLDRVNGESRDGAAEAELVRSCPTYSGRSYLVADDVLKQFAALAPPGTTMKLADLQAYWQNRAQIVSNLAAVVAHASEYEAVACQVAMPDMLVAAKAMEDHSTALGDVSTVLATAFEALHMLPAPIAGARVGSLTIAALASEPMGDDAVRACDAVEQVASVRDALQVTTGVPNDAADRVLRVATIGRHARDLDRALVDWIMTVDALAAGPVLDPVAAAAARAKADILIESVSQAASASTARWDLAVELAK